MDTKNLQTNDTTSYSGTLIVLCCLTWRLIFVTRRLVFVSHRLAFVTHRLVFVTRRLVFVTHKLVFVTRRLVFVVRRLILVTCRLVFITCRVQKCSYVKFSKSFIFVSPNEIPTGILPPQSIHLYYIGVLSSTRV